MIVGGKFKDVSAFLQKKSVPSGPIWDYLGLKSQGKVPFLRKYGVILQCIERTEYEKCVFPFMVPAHHELRGFLQGPACRKPVDRQD